jgi:hypothetical protein
VKRKIIKQGNRSFTLTLPVKWVRGNGFKGGEEVDINDDEGRLVITADALQAIRSASFSVKNMDEKNIRFVLNQLYRKGFSKIVLKDISAPQFRIVELLVDSQFSGVEIVNKTAGDCLIEVITEPKKDTFDIIFRKMFFIIQESLSIVCSKEDLPRIAKLTDKARVYEQFCKRFIANNIKSVEGFEMYVSLSYLLLVQTDINRMPKSPSVNDCRQVLNLFNDVAGAFYKKDIQEMYKTQKRAYEMISLLINKKSEHYITEITRIIYSLHSPLMGLIMRA